MRKRPPVIVRDGDRRIRLPEHPTDACPSKVRYSTEVAARMGAQSAISHPHRAVQPRMWVYHCERCHGWHLTRSCEQHAVAVTAAQLWEGSDGFPPHAYPQDASVAAPRVSQTATSTPLAPPPSRRTAAQS